MKTNKKQDDVTDSQSLAGYALPIYPAKHEPGKVLISAEKIKANRLRYKEVAAVTGQKSG